MRSIHKYIITTKGDRYANTSNINGVDFIVNTEMFNHEYVNREATVLSVPTAYSSEVEVGDTVIVHHNVFRRWQNQYAIEKNCSSYLDEDTYQCHLDQVYMRKPKGGNWRGVQGYCFVVPVKNDEFISEQAEKKEIGVVEVGNDELDRLGIKEGDTIAFTPESEYRFVVDGKVMYRMRWDDICLKLKDGVYEKYEPRWAEA